MLLQIPGFLIELELECRFKLSRLLLHRPLTVLLVLQKHLQLVIKLLLLLFELFPLIFLSVARLLKL